MHELYDDLENYDDVDTVNQLKTENSELKRQLEERNKSIELLQKDLDKLAAEFKVLETNYSSLLKIARAEIQRKTEMITNLNIEKDTLIITAAEKVPPNKLQKLVKNLQTEVKRKKKKKRNIAGGGPKDRAEFIRRECERPSLSDASHYSTATDNSNKLAGNEGVMDDKQSIRVTQENEVLKREMFPEQKGDCNRSVAMDRRVSALARHQFSKLSSDEEFEDMYSALKPTTLREPEKSLREPDRSLGETDRYPRDPDRPLREPDRHRKRGLDDSEDSKTFYNSHDRFSNYPEPFRDRFNKNVGDRFSSNERKMNRDKQYNSNKGDRYDSHCQRYSPERHRRGAKEHSDDRYTRQYIARSRQLVSPPRERNQHKSRERRRSCHNREREEQDAHRYNYPETHSVRHHIHGEYDEPQNKRPRIDPPYPNHQEERRLSEKQYSRAMFPSDLREHTCQSPDFSHEESSNEPVPEIRSTASTALEDPRVTSTKYVKSTEGNKEVLQSANANKIYLQPVNKSLWNLQEVEVPRALKFIPPVISEEHVDEMDTDKPMSIISMESGELGSETTDTVTDDACDFQEVNKSNNKFGSWKTAGHNIKKTHHKEKSPVESAAKEIRYKSETFQRHNQVNSPIENVYNDIGYKSHMLAEHHEDRSPIDKGHQRDVSEKQPNTRSKSEKYHIDKSPTDTTSKDIQLTSDLSINHPKEKSPIEIGHKTDVSGIQPKTRPKLVKSETIHRKADQPTTPPGANIVASNTHNDTIEKPSILQKLINSVLDKSPERDTSAKSSKSKEGQDRKETSELKKLDITEQKSSNTVKQKELEKHEKETPLLTSEPEKENVQIFREFEHRVYSTRHIVEGDLELSDESNDETQLKIDEKKIEVKVKQKNRRKSVLDTSKQKPVEKTRSKKDKEKPTNKFSDLFGDSSSLITPEDLNFATRAAHALTAECCPPAPEDAQDGIIESQEIAQTLPSKILNNISENKGKSDGSKIDEDKHKSKSSKDVKSRTHRKHKKSGGTPVSQDTHKSPDGQESSEVKKTELESNETPSATEVKHVLSNEKLSLMQSAKTTTDTNKIDAFKPNEKPKGSVKSNKKHKNKDEKRLSSTEPVEESNIMITHITANSNKNLVSDNKENASGNDNSGRNISSEIAKTFENTLVSDVSKVNSEIPLHDSAKDVIDSTVVQGVPNLAPVLDEPGLVKTVVISTGIQLVDCNSQQYDPTFNTLASSTPVKELPIVNNSSEMEPTISHSAHVSVTIERDDTVSQSENDAPDIRINYTRRRRKVLKR